MTATFAVGVLVGRGTPWAPSAVERLPVVGSERSAEVGGPSEAAPATSEEDARGATAPAVETVVGRRASDGDRGARSRAVAAAPAPFQLSWGDVASRAQLRTAAIRADQNYGSGIFVSESGLVITNLHVIEGAKTISVARLGAESVPAQLVDSDATLDLALLRPLYAGSVQVAGAAPSPAAPSATAASVAAASAAASSAVGPSAKAPVVAAPITAAGMAPLGKPSRTLQVGDEVLAVGSPRKMHFSVSRGMISFANRLLDGVEYIQTDLPINVGNSGGPLVDRDGHVVGVISFILRDSQGISFALPIERALDRFSAHLVASAPASPERANAEPARVAASSAAAPR